MCINVFVMNPSAPMQFFAKGLACCFSLYKSAYGKKCAIYESCVAKTWRVSDFDTLITQVLLKNLNVASTLMIMYLNSYKQKVVNFNPIPINCKTWNNWWLELEENKISS
jgi:hypothetical protein